MPMDVRAGCRSTIRAIQKYAPLVSGLILVALVIWVLVSRDARDIVEKIEVAGKQSTVQDALAALQSLPPAGKVVVAGITVSLCCAAVMLIALFVGHRNSRSLRAWLTFSLLVCGWLAATLGWANIYWLGQSRRISAEVAAAEQVASTLLADWPRSDGDVPELGFVLGYPKDDPTILMLAGEPLAVGNLQISAVERSRDRKTLRFQLAGMDRDTWLVRSADGAKPEAFVNGLETRYQVGRSRQLSEQWYMVRFVPEL